MAEGRLIEASGIVCVMAYTLEQLSDLQLIRDAVLRYCRGIDRLDAEEMKRAYWPDAVDDHGVFAGNGWTFVDRVVESHARWRATMHCIANHTIDLEPDGVSARGEIYNITYLFAADSTAMSTWFGRYLDRYEKRGSDWRIIHRACVHEATRVSAPGDPMALDVAAFRSGSDDRATPGRLLGT
jgi:hypothetical protein